MYALVVCLRMCSNVRQNEKKDDSNVAIVVNYGVASFLNWVESICNPKMSITRIRGPQWYTEFFQRRTPWIGMDKSTPISPRASPLVPTWLVENTPFTQFTRNTTVIGWIIGGRVYEKSSARNRKITHPRVLFQPWASLTLVFPWDLGEGLGFKAPFL